MHRNRNQAMVKRLLYALVLFDNQQNMIGEINSKDCGSTDLLSWLKLGNDYSIVVVGGEFGCLAERSKIDLLVLFYYIHSFMV